MIKVLFPLVPALISFGPVFMIVSAGNKDSLLRPEYGALMLGLGLALMLIKIVNQGQEIQRLKKMIEKEKGDLGN